MIVRVVSLLLTVAWVSQVFPFWSNEFQSTNCKAASESHVYWILQLNLASKLVCVWEGSNGVLLIFKSAPNSFSMQNMKPTYFARSHAGARHLSRFPSDQWLLSCAVAFPVLSQSQFMSKIITLKTRYSQYALTRLKSYSKPVSNSPPCSIWECGDSYNTIFNIILSIIILSIIVGYHKHLCGMSSQLVHIYLFNLEFVQNPILARPALSQLWKWSLESAKYIKVSIFIWESHIESQVSDHQRKPNLHKFRAE